MNKYSENSNQGNILIVDDVPDNLRVLSTLLNHHGYKVRNVIKGSMAIRVAKSGFPDVILLDINMPEMNGYEVCEALKSDSDTEEIPVIFLTALDEVMDKVKAFEVGGVDYITKPFQIEEMVARISNQIQLKNAKSEIKKLNRELEERVRDRTAQLEAEIVERKKAEEKLSFMALHDPLTELPNRTGLMARLQQVLQRVKENSDYMFGLLFLDCDRFKVVNDSLGHLVGDQLLKSLAQRLQMCINSSDIIARFGGDEFVIILDDIENLEKAISMTEHILNQLSLPFHLNDHEIFIGASIGIVLGTKDYQDSSHLLRDADIAMYQAKASNKTSYKVFDKEMRDRAVQRLQLETDLRRAIERQEFVVNYQPIINLKTGKIMGFEALVRWQHRERGLISPADFIPIAEETGLIVAIDRWVLQQACHQLRVWQTDIPQAFPLSISSNLSVQQFTQTDLMQQIDRVLSETELDSQYLKLEITESALIENDQLAQTMLEQFKKRQVLVSIDDFGTGYSSLSYLHRFPVDTLKIDRSFICRMGELGNDGSSIVDAIVTLAHHLGMDVVAEGVETKDQLAYLRLIGCEAAQGYFFSKPLNSELATELLSKYPEW
jgi:diguanylate cyclase (GGDEF)-like protein